MSKYNHPLSSVKIASPCSVDWENMFGNDRRRFCGQCKLNVYNLSDMTKLEAEELINQSEGRLCVRLYKRADGTILTRDCPVGLQAIKRRFSRIRTAVVSAVFGFLAGSGFYAFANTAGDYNEPVNQMGVMVAPEKLEGSTLPGSDAEQGAMTGQILPIRQERIRQSKETKIKIGRTK